MQKTKTANYLIVIILMLFLSACANANLKVMKPVSSPPREVSLNIMDSTSEHISEEDSGNLKAAISSRLQESGIQVVSSEKPGVTSVVGKIQKYDSGNRALRYFIGFGAGTGSIDSSWSLVNQSGKEEANCNINGSISGGVFGGNFYDVHDEVAKAFQRFLMGKTE